MYAIRSIYRFVALMMAFLVLFTSTSFTLSMHYCCGELKSVSVVGKAKTCHDTIEEKENSNCLHHKKRTAKTNKTKECFEIKDCCSDKTVCINAGQDQQVEAIDFIVSNQFLQFASAFVIAFFVYILPPQQEVSLFKHYRPPLLQKNIPVFNQSFLL